MVDGDLTAVVSFIGIVVQLCGELLLLTLFLLLRRHVLRRGYFTAWTLAWGAGAVAILALCVRYVLMPQLVDHPIDEGSSTVAVLYLAYQLGKLASLALFVSGTAMYVTGSRLDGSRRLVVGGVTAYALLSVLATGASLNEMVIWQAPVAVVCLGACAALLFTLPASRRTMGSLAGGAGFAILALLWLVYGLAFGLAEGVAQEPVWASSIVQFNTYFDLLLNFGVGFAMVVLLMEDAKREVDDAQAELRVQHDQLRRAALFDSLTDSLNRTAFAQGVGLEMARGTFGTVVIADLDNLKAVNDAWGHAAGDRLLRQCADLLRGTLRAYDKLYRWGGDEFLLIIPSARSEDVGTRLREVLREAQPLQLGGTASVKLEVSLGTSDYTSAEDLEEAIQLADQAMYRQKHARKTPYEAMPALPAPAQAVADY